MTHAELERLCMLDAAALIAHYRATLPWFAELTPAMHRLMTRHRWMTLAQAYEVAGMAYAEQSDDGEA